MIARVLRLLAALALLAVGAGPAAARVVGIVFDDSGSMAPRIHLPTFGVQLLVSTLDGRPGIDRLLTLRLREGSETYPGRSDAALPEQPIRDPRQLQGTIDRIRATWPKAEGGTPYPPVEMMVRNIVRALKPREAGFLVVVSDGEFSGPPDRATLRAIYGPLKAELDRKGASLRVEFLMIAFPNQAELERVEKQGVRTALLEVFNGGADGARDGKRDVTNVRDLLTALKAVIAEVSGTAETLADRYVRADGVTRIIDTPLAISRLVAIATARDGQPIPQVTGTSFSGAQTVKYGSRMKEADTALPGIRQVAETTQFEFSPRPLFAGTHRLTFDRPVDQDVMLVFQTAASIELAVLAENGAPVARDAAGRVPLIAGARYRLAATLVDDTPQGRRPVALASLKGPVSFTAVLDARAGPQRMPMTIEPGTDRAVAEFTAGPAGEGSARGEVTLDGFVTPESPPLPLVVLDGTVGFDTVLRGLEPCPSCPAGTVAAVFDATRTPTDLAEVTITPRGAIPGTARLDREGLPAWIEVLAPSGAPLAAGAAVPFVPGTPIRLILRRSGTLPGTLPGRTVPIALALKPDPPLAGEGRVAGLVRIAVTPASLRFREHAGPDDGAGRALARAATLVDGSLDLVFSLGEALAPVAPDQFTVIGSARFIGAEVAQVAGDRIVVRPRSSWWCSCFLWWDAGPQRVALEYHGPGDLQTARAETEIVIAPTVREIVTGCLLLVLLALLVAWLVGAVVVAIRTARFPRGSVAEIHEGNQLPRHVDLRTRHLTLLRALAWPVRRLWAGSVLPNEHRTVEGLTFVARRGGLTLKLDEDACFEVRGQDVREMMEINAKLTELRLNWREDIILPGPPRIEIRLLRTLDDATLL